MQLITRPLQDSICPIIVHGCNAQAVMGSGVAKALYEKWPIVKDRYLSWCGYMPPKNRLSKYSWVKVNDDQTVINLVTQEYFGKDGQKYARYISIFEGLNDLLAYWGYMHYQARIRNLAQKMNDIGPCEIAVPKIGCGLGGLDWNFVEQILFELEEKWLLYEVEFIVHDI